MSDPVRLTADELQHLKRAAEAGMKVRDGRIGPAELRAGASAALAAHGVTIAAGQQASFDQAVATALGRLGHVDLQNVPGLSQGGQISQAAGARINCVTCYLVTLAPIAVLETMAIVGLEAAIAAAADVLTEFTATPAIVAFLVSSGNWSVINGIVAASAPFIAETTCAELFHCIGS